VAPALDPLEEGFDPMTFLAELRNAPSVAGAVATRRDANQAAMALDELSKCVRLESLVPDKDHGFGRERQQVFRGGGFRARNREEEEGHDVSSFINGQGQLRVGPALGEPHCLILRASDRPLASLVNLDEGAVDET